jgi:hypothetical protein
LSNATRLRFVVGVLDTWSQLCSTRQHAAALSLGADNFNLLGLEPMLSSKNFDGEPLILEPLPYKGGDGRIVCTQGPLAACLLQAHRAGAQTIKEALSQWIIPRHAEHFAAALNDNRILLWLRVLNDEDERAAYRCLLAQSSNSVGVHDIGLVG